jgi:ubiquinone/menaquinone biosynthesis C-methylase UbiE
MVVASNPFMRTDAAERYAKYRPDFSPHLRRVIDSAGITAHRALDVAAGTGISTRAVAMVAHTVIAIDASPAMTAQAPRWDNVVRVIGSAEKLPLRDMSCDLTIVGSALHWFHRDAFVAQAARVATDDAYLVVHDHGFTGQMDDVPGFHEWIHHRYLRGYPAPPRGEKLAPGVDLGPFRFLTTERYEQTVEVTRDHLAGYLTTQSNLQVVMTSPQASTDVLHWLEKELNPFFESADHRTVRFAGMVTVLQR